MLWIGDLFFKTLRLSFTGVGTVIAVITVLSVAAAQAPSTTPTGQAAGDSTLSGASLDYFPRDHLFRIMGKDVMSAKGEDMGRIVDVLFDEKGAAHAAVIDFGGFLGVGTRKIAVSWSALRFDLGEKRNVIALDLGREQLKAAPEYKESDKPIPVVAQPQTAPAEATPDPGR
jgi:PRC-barrel domain protein